MPVNAAISSSAKTKTGRLYIAGSFTRIREDSACGLAYWSQGRWSGVKGCPFVSARSIYTDGSDTLYCSGSKNSQALSSTIFRWNGTFWDSLGLSFDGPVLALKKDKAGNLYAAGNFQRIGADTLNRIARWDGTKWNRLGKGIWQSNASYVAIVRDLVIDKNGDLMVGGSFDRADTVTIQSSVARWNGTTFTGVGDSIANIQALAVDSSGVLYAAGDFDFRRKGLIGDFIARWNGADWVPVSNGNYFNNNVTCLAVDTKGTLFAGGDFYGYSGWTGITTPASGVARLRGNSWEKLGDGVGDAEMTINTILCTGTDSLFVGGSFSVAGGITSNYAAHWDGSAWRPCASGVEDRYLDVRKGKRVYTLAAIAGDTLFVGGAFDHAGTKDAFCMALLRVPKNISSVDISGTPDVKKAGRTIRATLKNNYILFSGLQSSKVSIRLFSLKGMLLRVDRNTPVTNETAQFPFMGLAPGNYCVQIQVGSRAEYFLVHHQK